MPDNTEIPGYNLKNKILNLFIHTVVFFILTYHPKQIPKLQNTNHKSRTPKPDYEEEEKT